MSVDFSVETNRKDPLLEEDFIVGNVQCRFQNGLRWIVPAVVSIKIRRENGECIQHSRRVCVNASSATPCRDHVHMISAGGGWRGSPRHSS